MTINRETNANTAEAVSCIGWGTSSIHSNWSWRSITLIQAVPSIIQIAGVWTLPESPRWLVSKDRADEALAVLAKHHAGGDVDDLTVRFQYREITDTIQHRQKKNTSYLDFLKTKGNRWRLAIIVSLGVISQYSGNALFSNYINIVYEGAGITQQNKKLAVSRINFFHIRASRLTSFTAVCRENNNGPLSLRYRSFDGR